MRKHSRLSLLSSLLCVLALLLSACGDIDVDDIIPPTAEEPDKPDEALEEFENQEIVWETCDPGIFPEQVAEVLEPLGDRLECATLKTPLDWENPKRDAVNLGVLRVRAGDESKRKGAILLNPGGPGGDGLIIGAVFGAIFAGTTEGEVVAPELLKQVSEQYDIVGFSPRGLGGSFQIFCGSNASLPPANFYADRSKENVQALLSQARLIAEACQNTALSDFVSSEQTVQDMDLIRRLLGDEKLNYLGFSYGSWLGAWYAKRFPANAGNIVLDANTDFSKEFEDLKVNFIMGFQRSFEDVAAPYLARNAAVFNLGESEEEIYNLYDDLRQELKTAVTPAIVGSLYNSQSVPFVGASLIASQGVSTVLDELEPLAPEDYEAFLEQVASYPYSEDEEQNAELSELALEFAQTYLQALEPSPVPAIIGPSGAVTNSIICNDSPWNQDPQYYAERGDELNEAYPFLGGSFTDSLTSLPSSTCAFWGEPSASMPDIPADLPPVMMVQSGYDSPTPAEGAIQAFETLPNAHLVYIENELNHGVFPYNTECVDIKVATYLLDGTLPEGDVSNCDALPLPGETQIFVPGTAPSAGGDVTTQGLKAATSAGENELYDLAHELLRENAAAFFGHARD